MAKHGQAEPMCPRCGYDLSGQVRTWTDACPLAGVCTECGFEVEYRFVLNPGLTARWRYFETAVSRPWEPQSAAAVGVLVVGEDVPLAERGGDDRERVGLVLRSPPGKRCHPRPYPRSPIDPVALAILSPNRRFVHSHSFRNPQVS